MQSRPTSAGHQTSWGPHGSPFSSSNQSVPLPGLHTSPWQQTAPTQWGLPSPQPGMPGVDLRSIMQQEEQQAALQGHASASHTNQNAFGSSTSSTGNPRHDSANSLPPGLNISNHYGSLTQQPQQHLSQQQLQQQLPQQQIPQQQLPQQQLPQQQRSGGFYMRNKRDVPVPVKQNWAQVTTQAADSYKQTNTS